MLEENMKNEAQNAVTSSMTPRKKEHRKKILCLHVSSNGLSPQASADLVDIGVEVTNCSGIEKAKDLCKNEVFGVILVEEIKEENKDFITNLKVKGSHNEQTPVIYIAQGIPSEDVKRLVKDQYIDDIVFKCPSLDNDLIKAVKRLINEPLQFAVTPKSKRGESVTPKSKKGESSTSKRQKLEKKIPMSARRCIANNFPITGSTTEWSAARMNSIQEDGTTFINLDSSTATHHAAVYESSINPEVALISHTQDHTKDHTQDQIWMLPQHHQYNQYIPVSCPIEYQHSPQETRNKMQLLTAAAEMSQAMTNIEEASPQNPTSHNSTDAPTDRDETANVFTNLQNLYPATQENSDLHSTTPKEQQVNSSTVNEMQLALENAERAINRSLPEMLADELVPKITLSGARQLLDSALLGVQPQSQPKKVQHGQERNPCSTTRQTKKYNEGVSKTSTDGYVKGKSGEKPKKSQRGRRSGTFNMEKQEWTPNTIEERKELHLSKERKRRTLNSNVIARERIARCWHQLRRMIPMCADNADKATVFEMTVAYLHHCWKHHAQIILKINRDFERFCNENGPPENLDEIDNLVTKLLDLEDQ